MNNLPIIVRVRSEEGQHRITVSPTETYGDLLLAVCSPSFRSAEN